MTLIGSWVQWTAHAPARNRDDINWFMGPMDPTCTRQERMKHILLCYWDISQDEKGMPPSPIWDGLPI